MCDNLTYRSAGAETLVRMNPINILLRWSKEGVLGYVGTAFVQLNSPDEPISYIRTHVMKVGIGVPSYKSNVRTSVKSIY